MEMYIFLFLCLGFCIQEGIAQTITPCKENEEYFECGSQCPLTCKNYQDPIFCTKPCTKGCFCKPGFVIGPNGKCVQPTDCPVGPCRENEQITDCVSPCNTCSHRSKCYFEYCDKGCDCKPGFFKNSTGCCVPANKCDVRESSCPRNEHYVSCVNHCNDCWNRGVDCDDDQYCHPGCDCLPGFFRNENEDCVPEKQCGKTGGGYCGGANEEYSDCAVPCNDCQTRGKCQYHCEYGCDCKQGYHRDSKGLCVPASQCPGLCPQNEEYQECGSACPVTCQNRSQIVSCNEYCVKGCFCRKGYVRGPDGKCVNPDNCPLVCGVNEEYLECGSPCPLTCTNLTRSSNCPKVCVQGCVCKPGYVRGPNGACLLPSQCPAVCSENEEFLDCGSACPSTCENFGKVSLNCSLPCRKGCFCKPGYVRGPGGKCLLPQQCPIVCSENEEFLDCGSACPSTCENFGKVSLNCSLPCRKGCFCKPGYVRGPDGKCLLPQQCPIVCEENEQFLECGPGCQASCGNASITSCNLPCVRGCFCKPGFIRGPDGKCIIPQQCPILCPENEEFHECGSLCQGTCDTPSKPVGLCPTSCKRGCFCKPGFVRDLFGRCILPEKCPVVCQENEVFLKCGSPCQDTCENIGNAVGTCPLPCIKGCFCKPGYIRGPNGKCILPNQCPLVCQGNEVLLSCGSPCQRTCTNFGQPVGPCTLPCIKGCFCKPGYVRGPTGDCILPTECPVVCGENEEYQKCATACMATCKNYTSSNECTLPCVDGCICKPGYVRSPDGRCILPSSCPVVCGENEIFENCGSACPKTCRNRNAVVPCTLQCIKGCFCKPGYVRGPNGRCMLPSFCPVVCGENEVFQKCGSACPITCNNRTSMDSCTLPCKEGCFCKPGFIRGPNGKCIMPRFCPVVCGENEIFENCGSACPKTCRNRNAVVPCTLQCIKGCFCKPGYVRGPNGRCILPSFCPVVCGENEVFQKCGSSCPITCNNRTSMDSCTLPCKEGCFCKPGFIRGPNGKCIMPRFCPVECGENELFYECSSPCQRTCENRNSVINCTLPCLTGCFCKPGFVRDSYGKCIDPLSCPIGPCTKENEIYNPCGPACIKTCARLEFRQGCPQRCVRGCFCKEGFVRDIDANCIPFERCPKRPQMCPAEETFYACKPTCRDTCDTLEFEGPCDDLCRPGCDCRGGLVRNTLTNMCVPPRECPNSIVGRKRNAVEPDTTTILPETQPAHPVTEVKPPATEVTHPPSEITHPVTQPPVSKTLPPNKEEEPQKTKPTAAASPVTLKPQTTTLQPKPPKTKEPPTTLNTPVTQKEGPTIVQTKALPVTTIKTPLTTAASPTTLSPVTLGKTNQQETSVSPKPTAPVETTPQKPVETTPQKPVNTTSSKPNPPAKTTLLPTTLTAKPEVTTQKLL
ncbi:hypothetical protein JTE90_027123 [Oedothorax gibbosus]|uniref:EGF-like domain-containing protein n=1 Tax=Oedothorax gibbosus TaxID=931172 RepID=A0AAV6U233_9ARAC|nr:hypothetical protein JTE90_027123 [Oedothorax gibbosus]